MAFVLTEQPEETFNIGTASDFGSYHHQLSLRLFACPRSRISTANGLPADNDGGALNCAAVAMSSACPASEAPAVPSAAPASRRRFFLFLPLDSPAALGAALPTGLLLPGLAAAVSGPGGFCACH